MAEHSGLYNATNNSPEYGAVDLARFFNLLASGIAYGYENHLEVTKGAGMNVVVDSGGMISKGWFYIQDEAKGGASPKTFSIDAATAGYCRKDRVVVEFDTDNGTCSAKVIKGDEVLSDPAVPALTQTATKWQVSLCIVNVESGNITSIDDERQVGNGRTNPSFSSDVTAPNLATKGELNAKADLSGADFSGDITAPNVGANDGGKVYLNTAKTAYIRYDNYAVYIKIPTCDEVMIPGIVYSTQSSAPAGTYPKGTLYADHD